MTQDHKDWLRERLILNPMCTRCGKNPHALSTQWCKSCKNEYARALRKKRGPQKRTELQLIKRARRAKIYKLTSTGKLKRMPCEVCGDLKTHAHHHRGYSKEMAADVRWLCCEHHHALEKWEKKYLTPEGNRISSVSA